MKGERGTLLHATPAYHFLRLCCSELTATNEPASAPSYCFLERRKHVLEMKRVKKNGLAVLGCFPKNTTEEEIVAIFGTPNSKGAWEGTWAKQPFGIHKEKETYFIDGQDSKTVSELGLLLKDEKDK